MDDEGVAIGIIALVLALAGLGLVLSLPAGMSATGLLFANGTRPLTANWNQGAYNLTNSNSWFLGHTLITTLTLSTSNITSGTFALSYVPRLDLTKIPFGTSGNLSTLVGFTVTSRSNPLNAHQGVAFDGTYYYTTKSPVGTGDYIYKYNATFSLIDNRDVSGDLPVGFTQINSMYYKDGLLYVGCSNVAVTPKEGHIVVFNVVDLSLNATHDVKALWTEGCAFYNNSWWVIYDGGDESKIVSKYDTSWSWVADYDLTFSQEEDVETTIKGYQGIRWIGDYLFVNSHENLIPATLDVYKWNGAGFDKITRAAQPSLWASQGFDVNSNGSIWYFAERYYSGNSSDYRIIIATPIEQGYFLEGFDSPTDSAYSAFSGSDIPTLDASKIISGKFGTTRLDLSALSQNIVFKGTQTVDGIDISAYINQAVLTTSAPTFGHLHLGGLIDGITTISMSGQLTNMLAVGTAPFAITSTTKVANLNVEQVDGYDLDQALLIASSPTFAHIHSSAIGSVLTGSGAGYGGTPSLLIEDTSTRATLVMNTITDNALDITFKTNNAIHWDISARSSGNNYDLIFYRWKTVTPCITLSYDTGLVTLEGSLKIGSIITMPNEGALWWTNSTGYNQNIMRLNGANNMIMNTQPSKSWIWYSSAPDYYSNFVIYDNGNVDVRSVLTASGGVVTKYMSGDYGLTWTQTMPTGINGMMVTVYNSNAGILSSRWYVYSNGGWHWSALT